jgi:hypothetical protein
VDEVVIYNDGTVPTEEQGGISEPNAFLAHLLQFLETPQYIPSITLTYVDISAHTCSLSIPIYDTQDSLNQWT